MNALTSVFDKAREKGRAALIPYVTAGYPTLARLPGIVAALTEAGADIIEIGIPFSDPLADGPVLQRAATEALAQGTRVSAILETVRELAPISPPLVFLTYINPVFRYGVARFSRDARDAGMAGLIIPDLPWAEGQDLRLAAEASGLAVIPLVAPTSTDRHLQSIRTAKGFVYGVSVTGVTGMREAVDTGVRALVERVKRVVPLPVAVGFGIANAAQAREVARYADGVIVGSALVKAIMDDPAHAEEQAYAFVKDLKSGLSQVRTKA
ncbi:MAG: tryptophan synthase subunit alpha [Firmicutes bacterium]|nr:tryptophan synthase subunit alpha [Bacillota bacterium]